MPRKKSDGAKKTATKKTKKKTATKKAATKKTTKKSATKATTKKAAARKKGSFLDRYRKDKDPFGPWTCPKCGPLERRAQPLYGEDEKHHCPNVECDAIVTLLTKEDLEPTERRGSWPPQRNKNKSLQES